jgi:hypothetical protein
MRRASPEERARARVKAAESLVVQRGESAIQALQGIYAVGAVVYIGLAGLVAAAFLAVPGSFGKGAVVALLVLLVPATILILGAIFVRRRPFPWAIATATLVSLGRLEPLLAGRFSLVGIAWCALLWVAAVAAYRLEQLRRRHPDAYFARSARGETAVARADGATARARRRQGGASAGTWKWVAGVAGVVALLVGARAIATRPEPIDRAISRFQDAWDAGDVNALGAMFREPQGGDRARRLDAIFDDRGWTPRPPAAVRGSVETRNDEGAVVRFVLADDEGEVVTTWSLRDRMWVVEGLRIP